MDNIAEQTGKTTRSFFSSMREQPLSLALVIMNFTLLFFLFYSGASQLNQRKETVELIVSWQRDSDKLLANCVSKDIMETVVKALERDRELYRSLLPPQTSPPG
jgi:hypothetical protein